MDLYCVAGTVEQAEQPNYLAKGQVPFHCAEQKALFTCGEIKFAQHLRTRGLDNSWRRHSGSMQTSANSLVRKS
eukprot:1161314-Pelagomonas_calceolata.AAC.1